MQEGSSTTLQLQIKLLILLPVTLFLFKKNTSIIFDNLIIMLQIKRRHFKSKLWILVDDGNTARLRQAILRRV